MKSKIIIALFLIVVGLSKSEILSAQAASASDAIAAWSLLGSRTVDYLIDRDEIVIEASTFDELKFSVKNGSLSMHKCTLHFIDGSTKDIEFPENVKASTDRTIDLKGSNKKLDKVIFWYDTSNKSEVKAIVELWGKEVEDKGLRAINFSIEGFSFEKPSSFYTTHHFRSHRAISLKPKAKAHVLLLTSPEWRLRNFKII